MQVSRISDAWADEPLDAIAWYEGLQLLPQHFQQWERRLERMIGRHANGWMGYGWGIDRIEWDVSAIARGRVRVVRAQGVFPDGLVFNLLPESDSRLELELAELPMGTRVRVALAVARRSFVERGAQVSRFSSLRSRAVADWRDSEEQATLQFEAPNVMVRVHDDSSLYAQLPFLELERTSAGWLNREFHPPAVEMFADSPCLAQLHALSLRLRRLLEKVQPHVTRIDAVPAALEVFEALSPMLPTVEAMCATPCAHPFQWYMVLAELAGAISVAARVVPPAFHPYEHSDLSHSLMTIRVWVDAKLTELDSLDLRPVTLEAHPFSLQGEFWASDVIEQRGRYGIVLQLDFEDISSDVHAWIDHTLICAEHDVARCRERRIRGLGRRYLQSFGGLHASHGRCYLEVEAPAQAEKARLMLLAPIAAQGVRLQHVHLLRAKGK
ncbi:type VI secretion system baseplate subunit TssK [Caballeronia zhejiangensis]|uniref:type VI secretion system baseplate subunit TssK n=1 Tax=Caballeronia zhejiangensis TaxID=871203 RepID=UPI00158894C2|nr:type VI secretion system baseplate subunit TssK [Caballeronia zhejiangensis]